MTYRVSEALLSRLSETVAAKMGLNFPQQNWTDLERRITAFARELDYDNIESCIEWIVSSPLKKKDVEILTSYLTVGETYFFREKKSFKVFENHILPELIRSQQKVDRHLRIWSAGCSSGEEPYSIAMLLSRTIPNIKDWNITILATDINPRFLQKASLGVYKEWSFRGTPSWVKKSYFRTTKDGRFEISRKIKKMVDFSFLNLAEDTYPSLLNNTNAMDVIFCRNVLIYFAPDQTMKVIHNLNRALMERGWLFVSPSETPYVQQFELVRVHFKGVILYRKDSDGTRTSSKINTYPARPDILNIGKPIFSNTVLHTKPKLKTNFSPEHKSPFSREVEKTDSVLAPPTPSDVTEETQQTPYLEALALYEQGRYMESADKLVTSLDHDQSHYESKVMALLARAYANQGKLADAFKWCEKAITTDKLNPGYHYLLGIILQEQGQIDKAIKSYKQALYLDQNFVIAYFSLGNLLLNQGNTQGYRKSFNNALALLADYKPEETLPESEGMTAGRLSEIITSIIKK